MVFQFWPLNSSEPSMLPDIILYFLNHFFSYNAGLTFSSFKPLPLFLLFVLSWWPCFLLYWKHKQLEEVFSILPPFYQWTYLHLGICSLLSLLLARWAIHILFKAQVLTSHLDPHPKLLRTFIWAVLPSVLLHQFSLSAGIISSEQKLPKIAHII